MPTDRLVLAAGAPRAEPPVSVRYDAVTNASLFACVASGAIAFIEPSPYDLLLIVTLGLWFLGGFTLHRFVIAFAALILLYNAGGFLALLPYLNETDPSTFMVNSLYLGLTSICLAILFGEHTLERTEICLKAYAISTVVAAVAAIMGYFNIAGTADIFTLYGRASGTFKDPNVLGSYLILGGLYLTQTLILGRTRHVVVTATALLIVTAGVFLSFSRGSWGAFTVATVLMVGFCFTSSQTPRTRRRIVTMTVLALGLAVLAVVVLLSIDSVRELFLQRFSVTQDYDEGATGRFGNQLRAIPMLIERLNGFGPVRFRLLFDEDPHNSYVNAFASYGWLGGSAFVLLVGLTLYVGFRLVVSRSPFQRPAQVVVPALFVLFMQGFQIDIDHWRHVYLMLGMIWGMETARIRLIERGGRLGRNKREDLRAAPKIILKQRQVPETVPAGLP